MDFGRPSDKYWMAHGVYPGACSHYWDANDLCIPVFGIAFLPAGTRAVLKGAWEVIPGSITTDNERNALQWTHVRKEFSEGNKSAAALVVMSSHPRPGDDYGVLIVVLDVVLPAPLVTDGPFEPLPGMERLREQFLKAARSVHGLRDADYTRPEPFWATTAIAESPAPAGSSGGADPAEHTDSAPDA